ncbi:hypothetical protein, partial [Streptomyces chromofuscus]
RRLQPPEFQSAERRLQPPEFQSAERRLQPPEFQSPERRPQPPDSHSPEQRPQPPEFQSAERDRNRPSPPHGDITRRDATPPGEDHRPDSPTPGHTTQPGSPSPGNGRLPGSPASRPGARPGSAASGDDARHGSHASGDGTRPASPAPGNGSPSPGTRFPALPAPPIPDAGPLTPPPPPASARFPDAPPRPGRRPLPTARDGAAPAESPADTTRRLRPVPEARPARAATSEPAAPMSPDPAHSWGAQHPSGGTFDSGRPVVTLAEPEAFDDRGRTGLSGVLIRRRTLTAAVCLVLGAGLIGGAVTGSWLAGDSGEAEERGTFAAAGSLWHSAPVDQLFPPTVQGRGAGPGGADRIWTRIAVAPDSDCVDALDPLLRKALAPVGCERLLRATYTDATESYVTTVGLLFTKADATAMRALDARFERDGLGRRTDLMPRPYAAKDTVAAGFGDEQRASWTVSVLTDAPVVVYAVSGWADARTVDEPQPAAEAMRSGVTTAAAQAGLGHEAKGLADRAERSLRKSVTSSTEQAS